MKITHVVRQFYPSIGGLEDYVQNLALEQVASGHEVSITTLNTDFQSDKTLVPYEVHKGLPITRVPWKFSTRYPICQLDLDALNQADLVNVHAVDYLVDYLSLMKRLGRLKPTLVLTTHGGFFHTAKNQRLKQLFFKTVTRFTLAKVDALLCCSANDLDTFTPISANSHLINNGVGLRKFGEGPDIEKTNDMVYLGRFSSNKRLLWLIEAYARLKQPMGVLKIIGRRKTGDTAALEALIQQLGCADRVQLIVDVEDSVILGHLASARFTVSASEYEGFGLSVIELMSYGLVPFLSDETPSFAEFIQVSGVGELFHRDFDDFSKQYERLVSRWTPASAQHAQAYTEQFAWTAVSEEIFHVYESAVDHSVRVNR
jgi:alpha-1,3-mannosyltransferase